MQIDFTAAKGVSSPPDWYNHGFVDVLEPMLLGGQAAFSPVFFRAANVTWRTIVEMLPGKFPIHAFGGANTRVTLGDNGDILLNIDGSNPMQQTDAHGFPSTLGRAVQVVPIEPTLNAPGTKRLPPKCDEPISNYAVKFKMRRYSLAMHSCISSFQ